VGFVIWRYNSKMVASGLRHYFKSANFWWEHTQLTYSAPMQQRPPVPDLCHIRSCYYILPCFCTLNQMMENMSPSFITVRHGSADTVVRAMNDFNGKCYFSRSDSSETFWRIFKKFCTVDYVGDRTLHANVGVNRFKGACLRMREVVAVRRLFFLSFLADRTATQYDRLLASSCCPSVCLSVCLSMTLCIVALRVGVRG